MHRRRGEFARGHELWAVGMGMGMSMGMGMGMDRDGRGHVRQGASTWKYCAWLPYEYQVLYPTLQRLCIWRQDTTGIQGSRGAGWRR